MGELSCHDRLLPLELGVVAAVLPLTSATGSEVGTTRCDSVRRWLDNRVKTNSAPGALVQLDFANGKFTGEGPVHEECFAVHPGYRRAAVGHVGGPKLDLADALLLRFVSYARKTTLPAMRAFHETWFWVAVATTGLSGLWGLALAIAKRPAPRVFLYAKWVAFGAMAVQVSAGLYLYGQGWRAPNDFHLFYGLVIAFTFAFAYIYRIQLERRPELAYGLLLLFIMGLGFRAWSNVY